MHAGSSWLYGDRRSSPRRRSLSARTATRTSSPCSFQNSETKVRAGVAISRTSKETSGGQCHFQAAEHFTSFLNVDCGPGAAVQACRLRHESESPAEIAVDLAIPLTPLRWLPHFQGRLCRFSFSSRVRRVAFDGRIMPDHCHHRQYGITKRLVRILKVSLLDQPACVSTRFRCRSV